MTKSICIPAMNRFQVGDTVRVFHTVLRQLGVLLAALFLAACASQEPRAPAGFETQFANRVFYQAYRNVAEIYIDETRVSELALSGLTNLSKLDPDITVAENGGRIQVYFGGEAVSSIASPTPQDIEGWAQLTAEAIEEGRRHSATLNSIDAEELYEAVLVGATRELNHLSHYAAPAANLASWQSTMEPGHIGVRFRYVDDGVQVFSAFEGGPAQRSGLKRGDIIVSIDGEPIAGLSNRAVIQRLRGPVGSHVNLLLRRKDQPDLQELSVVREIVIPETFVYRPMGNIAYFRVPAIPRDLSRRIRAALELAPGALEGIILDLRGNTGGELNASIGVADLFLADETITTTHGRHPDSHQIFQADRDVAVMDIPIVLLIDGGTASGGEIVAAALQDAKRAVVVGSISSGQGSIQTVLTLPNKGTLILTWTRIFAPSLYQLERRGVLPDICTTRDVDNVEDVVAQLKTGRLPIDRAIQRLDIDPNDRKEIRVLRDHCPPADGYRDIDMEVALELLSNPELYNLALGERPDMQ